MAIIQSLLQQAAVIRDATAEGENSALRVGSMFVSLIQALLSTLPQEVIDATGISYTATASNFVITFKTIKDDGTSGSRQIIIPTASSVIIFDGFADNLTPLKMSVTMGSSSDGYKVIFNRSTNTFLLSYGFPDPYDDEATGYNNWADGDDFGTFSEDGRTPFANRIYLDRSSGIQYRLADDGRGLVSIGSGIIRITGIGNESGNAQQASAGAASYSDGYEVVYLANKKRLVLVKKNVLHTFYANWADAHLFGTEDGFDGYKPFPGRLYFNEDNHTMYIGGEDGLIRIGLDNVNCDDDATSQFLEINFTSDTGDRVCNSVNLPKIFVCKTWAQLMSLRNAHKLIPGQMYRITDYITTVTNDPEAQSAGHPFDIVVMALSADSLSEHALAMHSARDTDGYFGDAKLEAWKIWYCLDNDTTRFQWADTTNGKGVIYRLIDEWQNDCPYDFKNIQFKRYKIINGSQEHLTSLFGSYLGLKDGMNRLVSDNNDYTWAYTFSLIKGENCADASVCDITRNCQCENNHIRGYFTTDLRDDAVFQVLSLNNIVCIIDISDMPGDRAKTIRYNSFGPDCYSITLFGLPCNNTFGYYCACNIVDGNNNAFGYKCSGNSFGIVCYGNTFGDECMDNIIGDRSECNTFGDGCSENILGKYSLRNTLSDRCVHNDLTSGCLDNKLSNHCRNNILGGDCEGNSFDCQCRSIELGNSCIGNIFGTGCVNIKFGNNYQFNTVGNDVANLDIDNEAGTRENVRYVNILNGTKLSANSYTVIPCPEDAPYSFFVGVASDGTPRMGFLADLL